MECKPLERYNAHKQSNSKTKKLKQAQFCEKICKYSESIFRHELTINFVIRENKTGKNN